MRIPHPSWKVSIDRLSSDWIDGGEGDGQRIAGAEAPAPAEEAEQHYLADLLLVDALLTNMADRAEEDRERRVRRVMAVVDGIVPASRPRLRFLPRSAMAAAAAVALVVLTVFWRQFTQNSLAGDVLLAVNEVCAMATDRVYTIERARGTTGGAGVYRAKLYLRGRSGFVISCGDVVLGRDADLFWLVDARERVTLSDDFHWIDARATQDELGLRFLQELSLQSRHLPLMQLAAVAELMRHDYDVTLSRGRHDRRGVDLLTGSRRSAKPELPATIQLWADVDTRIIHRAELRWEPDNAVILELLPDELVPDSWYSYPSHCREDFTVRRLPTKP